MRLHDSLDVGAAKGVPVVQLVLEPEALLDELEVRS